MDYRTDEQWQEMVENMINGNWTDAAKNAANYGFYANDMVNRIDNGELENYSCIEISDFIILAEMANNHR